MANQAQALHRRSTNPLLNPIPEPRPDSPMPRSLAEDLSRARAKSQEAKVEDAAKPIIFHITMKPERLKQLQLRSKTVDIRPFEPYLVAGAHVVFKSIITGVQCEIIHSQKYASARVALLQESISSVYPEIDEGLENEARIERAIDIYNHDYRKAGADTPVIALRLRYIKTIRAE